MRPLPRPSSQTALVLGLLLAGCVDSSIPSDDGGFPPPDPETIDVEPATWVTVPGKSLTFQATDPVSSSPLIWTAPSELHVHELESHTITLGSGMAKGKFQLQVRSSVDPEVVGGATIQVVPFGFSGTVTGVAGFAAVQPLADLAVTRGEGPESERRVFLALYDPLSRVSEVSVWDHACAAQLEVHPDQNFNPAQRPRVTADALGRAYWIEQYFNTTIRDRDFGILRRNVDGSIQRFDWTPDATGGLELVAGTDVACDDEGNLYFMAHNDLANLVVRFGDMFSPGVLPEVLGPLASAGLSVQLAVEAEGRLLVADGAILSRWSLPSTGGLEVDVLADLGASPSDLDVDPDGTIYASFDTHIDVLDSFGHPVDSISTAQVGLPAEVPFEHLLGLGIDGDGNMRLIDDPHREDLGLGASSVRLYALDVQAP